MIKCPKCNEVFHLFRWPGMVGKRRIDDSDRFLCEICKTKFESPGETFWESRGEHE